MFKLPKNFSDQKGVIPVIVLVAAAGLILFLIIASTFNFNNSLFSKLFPKQFSQAAGPVDVSLAPSVATVTENEQFVVDVILDPSTDLVSGAEVHITYDQTTLKAVSITKGTALPVVYDPCSRDLATFICTVPFSNAISTPGKVDFTLGIDTNTPPATSQSAITSIVFEALKPTVTNVASQIKIEPATLVSSLTFPDNRVGNLNLADITINSAAVTVNKTATFALTPAILTSTTNVEFPVRVMVGADTDEANLFSAKIKFDPSFVQVNRIATDSGDTFVTSWVDNVFDNTLGTISLVGAVPAPGFKTTGIAQSMATIYFEGIAPTSGTPSNIDFLGTSVIYRNSDNADILNSSTPAEVTLNGPVATPTPTPSPTPTPTAFPTAQPTATPTVAPTPTPTPVPVACSISGVTWDMANNQVTEGDLIRLKITGTGNCLGEVISFKIFEDDNIFGTNNVKRNPFNVVFKADNTALGSWLAEYQPDGFFAVADPPEYFFNASISGKVGSTVKSADSKLEVTKLASTQVTKGDSNRDGKVDLQDLSVVMTHFNKNKATDSSIPDEVDANGDGVVNAFDFATYVQLFKANGLISSITP